MMENISVQIKEIKELKDKIKEQNEFQSQEEELMQEIKNLKEIKV
jgi:hypothetical protein